MIVIYFSLLFRFFYFVKLKLLLQIFMASGLTTPPPLTPLGSVSV